MAEWLGCVYSMAVVNVLNEGACHDNANVVVHGTVLVNFVNVVFALEISVM